MKLAIFHCEEIPRLFLLEKAAKRAGFETHIFHYGDIKFYIKKDVLELKVGNISLKDFSLVFAMGFWDYQTELVLLASYCKNKKIPLFDTALYNSHTISKIHDLLCFKLNGFPVPKTVFLQNQDGADEVLKELKFPIVAKENKSRFGFNVHLLKTKKKLLEFIKKNSSRKKTLGCKLYQFQEYIPADFDVRVIVLGGKVVGAIERRSTKPNEFRHNLSLGGIAKKIELTKEMKALAVNAASALNYEFAGVDLIVNRDTGRLYILEVNRSPGFEGFMKATGIDVPGELMKFFLRFLGKDLQ